jgi:hypothetical protein
VTWDNVDTDGNPVGPPSFGSMLELDLGGGIPGYSVGWEIYLPTSTQPPYRAPALPSDLLQNVTAFDAGAIIFRYVPSCPTYQDFLRSWLEFDDPGWALSGGLYGMPFFP